MVKKYLLRVRLEWWARHFLMIPFNPFSFLPPASLIFLLLNIFILISLVFLSIIFLFIIFPSSSSYSLIFLLPPSSLIFLFLFSSFSFFLLISLFFFSFSYLLLPFYSFFFPSSFGEEVEVEILNEGEKFHGVFV